MPLSVLRHLQRQLAAIRSDRDMASLQAQVEHLRSDVRHLEVTLESRLVVLRRSEFVSSSLLGVAVGATLCFVVMARHPR